ncbi:MAG: aspartyl protease family protein [Fimbriimonas sp.]
MVCATLSLLLSLGLASPQQPTRALLKAEDGYRFVFEFSPPVSDYIVLTASIDGKRPMRFLLDTGSPLVSVLTPRAAKELGLKIAERDVEVAGLKGDLAEISKITLDAVGEERDFEFLGLEQTFITDLSALEKGVQGGFDGILGIPVLRQLVVRIDYQKRILELFPIEGHIDVPGVPRIQMRYAEERRKYLLDLKADQTTFPVALDTGSSRTFVTPNALEALKPSATMIEGGGSLYGEDRRVILRTKPLSLAGVPLLDVDPAVRLKKTATGYVANYNEGLTDGLLGNDVLAKFRWTFDFPNNEAFLEPIAKPLTQAAAWLSELATVDGRVIVKDAYDKLPAAEAGLKAGQEVVSIDERPPLPGFANIQIQGLEGTRATVKVREGDEEQTLSWLRPDPFVWATPRPSSAMGIHLVTGGPEEGVMIMQMRSGTPGWNAGLRSGYTIREIDGKPYTDPTTIGRTREVLTSGGATLTVTDYYGKTRKIVLPKLKPAAKPAPKAGKGKPTGRKSGD